MAKSRCRVGHRRDDRVCVAARVRGDWRWKRVSVYAIVRSGGRQHKVAVGDIVEIDRVADEVGSSISLQPLMLVDGDDITTDVDGLGKASVTAEVLGEVKGPKIHILKFKNKTGYKKRQGHRQKYTQVKVTGIEG